MVRTLIEKGVDLNVPDSDGWTPLHIAAQNGIFYNIFFFFWSYYIFISDIILIFYVE